MLLALTPVAQGADIDVAPEPAGWGWYVSVFGGWSMPNDIDVAFENFCSGCLYSFYDDRTEIDLDNGFMAGIALGAQVNEWLRGEVELSGNWHDVDENVVFNYSPPPGGSFTAQADGDVDALFLLANLWVDLPIR
jgi:hypothetical protein